MLNIQSSRNDMKRAIDRGGRQGINAAVKAPLPGTVHVMNMCTKLFPDCDSISEVHFLYRSCCEMPSSSAAAAFLFKQPEYFLLRIFVCNEEHLERVFKTNRCLETKTVSYLC